MLASIPKPLDYLDHVQLLLGDSDSISWHLCLLTVTATGVEFLEFLGPQLGHSEARLEVR